MRSSTSLLIAVLLACGIANAAPRPGETVPVDGMVITEDTTFVAGVYALPNGVSIGASGVTLDMNGAEIVGAGTGAGYGVTCIGFDDVTIANGVVRGYYYGVRIEDGVGVSVVDNDLSSNWIDPLAKLPGAPFLDINVGPDLGDLTNLGGGLFMNDVASATVAGNTLRFQANGIDLYFVSGSTIQGNDASDNAGWGIHLHASTGNTVVANTADRCIRPGLGDSAGVLVVVGSNGNQFLNNSFTSSGDGFFIGNENGCPSNDNLIQGNDGSFAGANAFEATFSSGNQFIGNVADGSNYGFWLGYSHTGNVIRDNSIRANNVNGIEIEHGQGNIIEANQVIGNGGAGIVLRTDEQMPFPPDRFPCLALPDQTASSDYTIRDNVIHSNFGVGMQLVNTTDCLVANNLVAANAGGTVTSNGANNAWSSGPTPGENIVGGPTLGGNYWGDYVGADLDDDGIGDTDLPYTNGGQIAPPGDPLPLVGDPDIDNGFENPRTLCDRTWIDLGPNTRTNQQTFDTANGTHFATDGIELYLLEGSNSTRLSRFDPAARTYEPRADVPEAVWDGGGLQYGNGVYFATVGVQFDAGSGGGKGPKLYAYDPVGDAWTPRADSVIAGTTVANEALAYDPVNSRLYATIVAVADGGDPSLRRSLAVYDPGSDAWLGATAPSDVDLEVGSEAEYLDGSVYVWRGGFGGGAVAGTDSYLHVYDVATGSWSATGTLQASGVVPGFRTGAFDLWGVAITSDPERGHIMLIGGEVNRQVYVWDTAEATWAVGPTAVYDGGWGDGLEWVPGLQTLYQIDGRNSGGAAQGTAMMIRASSDVDGDGVVAVNDLVEVILGWGPCPPAPPCPADVDADGTVGVEDLVAVILDWGTEPDCE